MTKNTFKKGLALLAASFPEKEIQADIIYACLQDLTDEQYIKAIVDILRTEKQINRATNLTAIIREKALTKDTKLPGEAWLEVHKQILSVGSYNKPNFKDPLIKKVVEIMGWRNLCLSENQVADRAHFLKIYETLVSRDEQNTLKGKELISIEGQKRIGQLINNILEKK